MPEHLLDQIRAARPAAPAPLRERVRALAAAGPAPTRRPLAGLLSGRRLLVAAPLTVVVALLAAGTIAVLPRGSEGQQAVSDASGTAESSAKTRALAPPSQGSAGAELAPVPGRLQRVDAEMSLRVDDLDALSGATKRAMRIAQSLGGYVASVQYDAPAVGKGGAQLVLRVPNAQIQSAITQLSALGTILGQRIGIEDLQANADELGDQITDTQRTIAQLERQLAKPALADEERALLQARLAEARRQLSGLQASLRSTRTEGSLATVQVSLTTAAAAAAPAKSGKLDTIREILAWEGTALLYVLVIAGPFVLLGLLVWLALRFRRRAREARLLEQN